MNRLILLFLFVFLSFSSYAQVSREQAINTMVNEVVGPDSLNFHYLYSRYEKMYLNDTLWLDGYFDFYICPYEEQWVFFIDDSPLMFWAHPCRIVFFNMISGEYVVNDDDWPPHPYLSSYELFFVQWELIFYTKTHEQSIINNEIQVFPNPCRNTLFVDIKNELLNDVSIVISDMLGNTVKTVTNLNPTENYYQINTDDIENGIYLLTIYQNNKLIGVKKIIINH